MVEIKIEGLAELKQAMLALPQRIARNALNAALLAAAQPIVKTAQAKAPVLQKPDKRRKPGTLRKNIRARKARPTSGNDATVIISVRELSKARIQDYKARTGRKAAENPDDPYYWRFQELGTSKRSRWKGGKGQRAHPFLRPAFAIEKDLALLRFRDKLRERIAIAQSSGGLAR